MSSVAVTGLALAAPRYARREEPELPLADILDGRGTESLDRESLLFASAGVAAAKQAGIEGNNDVLAGVVCGTCGAGYANYLRIVRAIEHGSPITPTWGPRASFNAAASELSIRVRATGPCFTVTSGSAAGLEAVLLGHDLITSGQASAVLTGGVDSGDDSGEPDDGAVVLALAAHPETSAVTLAQIEGGAIVFTPVASPPELQQAMRQAVKQALRAADRDAGEVDVVVTAPAWDRAVSSQLEVGLAGVDGLSSARLDVAELPGAVGATRSALAVLAAVLVVRRQASCALVVALEPDGRALAVLVSCPKSGGG